jgi:hypothetical protein
LFVLGFGGGGVGGLGSGGIRGGKQGVGHSAFAFTTPPPLMLPLQL